MSEINFKIKNENIASDSLLPITLEFNKEINYNCSECPSQIEIISIKEENNTIEFNCLNKEHIHNKIIKMSLKEYLEKMKRYNKKEINNDKCGIHKNKYVSYCFNCNCHLCEECLKTRTHLNHIKNNIIEIKPMNEELNIIQEVIKDYDNKIENLKKEKQNKIKELSKSLNNNKNKENEKIKKILIQNEEIKENELKLSKDKCIEDIKEIMKKYKNEINIRKNKYINDNNEIINKYKLIKDKENINYKYKINELENKFNEEINNLKCDKQMEKINSIKRISEIVLNTYNSYNNNYYNSININIILQSYIKNDYIKNSIMKRILGNKYDKIYQLILQKNKEKGDFKLKAQNEEELTLKYDKLIKIKIQEVNKSWKNKLDELKNKFRNELKEREIICKNSMEQIINNTSSYAKTIIEQKINNYNDIIKDILKNKMEDNLKCLNDKKKEFDEEVNDIIHFQNETKYNLEDSNIKFRDMMNISEKYIANDNE